MTKVLFTHSYFYQFDNKQWAAKQPYPPLGTIYAASYLRENNYEVQLYDTCLLADETGLIPVLEAERPKYLIIYDDGFNYLTKMCLTTMREAAFRMAKAAKAQGCTVIACSSDSTDHYATYLQAGVDYVLHGEGEITLLELLNLLETKQAITQVLGISYIENGDVKRHAKRPVLRNLDELPMPAWDLIDVAPYREIWESGGKRFSLNIATTRGCPFKCNWCAKPIYGNRYNSRSPERVVAEMEYLIARHQVDYFWMCDDIFGLKPGWVQQFRDIVQAKKLQFQYKIQSRVDLLLKEDTIQALVASGLHTAWLGAESGSQRILDAMDKDTKIEQIYEATRLLQKKGVRVGFFLQFGYLGEQKTDIDKTIQMVLDIMPDEIGISVSYPLPGTKFYEMVRQDLVHKSNWTDSEDLDMMFENTYSKDFYRKLHTYVHNRYRIKRGWLSLQGKKRGNALKNIASMFFALPQATLQHLWLHQKAQKR